jgi:hypothetical protein
MPIQFYCQGCGQAFQVADQMAGQQARCKRCGAMVVVPAPSVAGLSPLAGPLGNPMLVKPASSSLPPIAWVAIGVGVAAVLMIVGGVVMNRLGRDEPRIAQNGHATNDGANAGGNADANGPRPGENPRGRAFEPAATPAQSTRQGEPASQFPPTTPSVENPPAAATTPEAASPPASTPVPTAAPSGTAPASSDSNSSKPGDKTTKPAGWGNSATPAELQIPFSDREGVTVGPPGCPVLVVGQNVWNLERGRIVQQLDEEYEGRGHTALSGDGRFFAAALKSPNQENTPVRVWDCTTGKAVFVVPGFPERYVDLLMFSDNKTLALAGRSTKDIQLWEAETGRQLKSVETPGERLDQGKLVFTPDGEYFATVARDKLVVIQTKTGKTAAVMGAPRAMERPGKAGQPAQPVRASSTDSMFVYAWLQAMRFSSDATELAAISTHPVPRLMCWNNRGKVVFDEPLLQLPRMAFWEHTLQWIPDRSAWLISGHILDRQSGRVVLGVRKKFAQDVRVYAIDKDRLLGAFPHSPSEMTLLQVPWKRIEESLKLLADGTPALLSPSSPVSVHVDLGETRGDQEETFRRIGEALSARLARDGIRVQSGQKTYFQLRFAEQTGDTLPIYQRQSPFDFRGSDTGQTATEAKGSLVLALYVQGENKPLWRDTIAASSARSFREEITDEAIRESMLQDLVQRIAELNIPYFIPATSEQLALPVVVQ